VKRKKKKEKRKEKRHLGRPSTTGGFLATLVGTQERSSIAGDP
jgi:hypothetical protein